MNALGRFLSVLVLLALGGTGAHACTLRVAWEPYAPYAIAAPGGQVTGADIDVLAALAADVRCSLNYRELPWARILLEIEKGGVDLTASASYTPERDTWGRYSMPYRIAEVALFVRKGEAPRHTFTRLDAIADLPFTLGIIQDYFYSNVFDQMMKDPCFAARVEPAAGYAVNIQKLLFGRVDGVLADDVGVMLGEAKMLGVQDRIERLPLTVAAEPLHILFSRKTVPAAVVERINDAIARMRADGRLQAIIDRYVR